MDGHHGHCHLGGEAADAALWEQGAGCCEGEDGEREEAGGNERLALAEAWSALER